MIDAMGNIKTLVFDAVGRVGTIQFADGTRVTLQYDPLGRLTTLVDSGGTTTNAFSERGQLVEQIAPGGYRWSAPLE
jgi:YD repeat-containing protein